MHLFEQKPKEKRVCVKLQNIVKKKPKPIISKPKPKKIEKPKPKKTIKPKPKPKPKKVIKPKPKPKPKPKKTIKPKKVQKKLPPPKPMPLEIPIIKEEIKPQTVEKVVEKEPTKEPETVYEEVYEEPEEILTPEMIEAQMTQEYMDENIAKIIKLLSENLYYPRSARRRGIVGEVIVRFKIDLKGNASQISINTSDSDILSRAAIKTIESISGDFPKPKKEMIINVPINYTLR